MKRFAVLTFALLCGVVAPVSLLADDVQEVVAQDEVAAIKTVEDVKEVVKPQVTVEEEAVLQNDDEKLLAKNDEEETEEENFLGDDDSAEEFLNTLLASAAEEMGEEDFEKDLEEGMKQLEDLLA
jgi:hypothetical protein